MSFFSAILPLAGGLIGSKIQSKSVSRANALTNASNLQANRENIQWQKEFAKHGVSWKIADAKSAGVHPNVALGANTISFSPSSVGTNFKPVKDGQAIERAFNEIATIMNPINRKKDQEVIRSMELDNKIKEKQLDLMGKGLPVDDEGVIMSNKTGQADAVVYDPKRITAKSTPSTEAGVSAALQYQDDPYGRILVPSKDNMELIQDMNPHALEYAVNYVQRLQMESHARAEPDSPHALKVRKLIMSLTPKPNYKKGYYWTYAGNFRWVKKKIPRTPKGKVNKWRMYLYYDRHGGWTYQNYMKRR